MESKAKHVSEIIDEIGFGWFQIKLIVILGLLTMVDSMEITLVSVIGPLLKCDWLLTDSQSAAIAIIVFVGMAIGSAIFGFVSDTYGRLKVIILTGILSFYFGILSGFSTNFVWILLHRSFVSLGIGGMIACLSPLLTELIQTNYRNLAMISIMFFYTIGAFLESALAYIVGPTLGWQALLLISTAPILLGLLATFGLTESPQYLLLNGDYKKAIEILRKVALTNGKEIEIDHVQIPDIQDERGSLKHLFNKNYRKTTILLLIIWLSTGFSYFGIVLVSSTLPQTRYSCLQDRKQFSINLNATDSSCCIPLNPKSIQTLMYSASGEFFTYPLIFLLSLFLGRKWCFILNFVVSFVCILLLDICMPEFGRTFLLMCSRACLNGAYTNAFIYTNEVYPGSFRSMGFGICVAFSRLGAILTPVVAQLMLPKASTLGALLVYMMVILTGGLASAILPIETKGRLLSLTANENVTTSDTKKKLKSENQKEYETFQKTD